MNTQLAVREATPEELAVFEERTGGNWMTYLMDMQISRNFLNEMTNPQSWDLSVVGANEAMEWVKIDRLPMNSREQQNLQLCWQSVLSACHTLNMRAAFVLRRVNGRTSLYLGGLQRNQTMGNARNVLRQCMAVHLPGASLSTPSTAFSMADMLDSVGECSGVITGIPSTQASGDNTPWLQTLDKLARGITAGSEQKNYSLVVLADPARDAEISELQQKLLRLKSEIHTLASYSENESKQESTSKGTSKQKLSGLAILMGLLHVASTASAFTGNALSYYGLTFLASGMGNFVSNKNKSDTDTTGISRSFNREHRDFTVSYCEKLIDKHIERLEGGRSLGFWQTGVYVLGDESATVDSVLALLRSIYSGSESYVEPIRVLNTTGNEAIREMICNMRFVPLPAPANSDPQGHWHVLGRMYESLTTPLTTQELAIATCLPQSDVAGLRFVRNAVHFTMNPAAVKRDDALVMGKLMDMGAQQSTDYLMDIHSLVRHALVAGSTGSGKSTTCKRILREVLSKNIPVMIIEPAKDDYVQWALEMNKTLPEDRQFTIYMPGADEIDDILLPELKLNPFQPAAYRDSPVRLQQHSEHFSTLLNSCLPSEDVIPILIDEAVQLCIRVKAANAGIDIEENSNPQMEIYPTMTSLLCAGNTVIKRKTYAPQTRDSFEEILRTRFTYLSRGTRGSILNTERSVDFDNLFSRPVVINLSCLAGSKDKALIMSLLLLELYEYRKSRYAADAEYRAQAQKNHLMHLMLIEEAHNVLAKPIPTAHGGSPEMAAADLFTNILSEIRSYGQGMMIVDQVPTRLIEDAIKNTNYKIAHRLTAPDDIELMARGMSLSEEQGQMISSLEIGHAIVCGDQDDGAAWVKMNRG